MTGSVLFTYWSTLDDLADLDSGDRVLDVATGEARCCFQAVKVGPTGHVTAIDFSPDMVRETAKDIESRKLSHAEIRHMDAEQMNLPDASFDWIIAEPFGCSLNLAQRSSFTWLRAEGD